MKEIDINANAYNCGVGRVDMKYKIWSSAGIMLTYWCPAACSCCYVHCGPDAGSAETEMSVEMAIECWKDIRRLAGDRGLLHLTGGEPFGDYGRLIKILEIAHDEKLQGLEKIETNAYWCTDEKVVRQRLTELKALGVKKLHISTDIYHQEFIPIENVQLLVNIGREILGEDGLQIRWLDYFENPVSTKNMSAEQRLEVFKENYFLRKERLLGRAVAELPAVLELKGIEELSKYNCRRSIFGAKHIHIDGAGNVFSGTCVGIKIGTISQSAGLYDLWCNYNPEKHPIFSILAKKGPVGLLDILKNTELENKKYADKCHLCYEIRRYLYENAMFIEHIGPGICYGCNK
ncbi:MAG: hypothetical protein JEZ07_13350 [Phycisphaerae bacterium]|nr:hypothetical protein [Phycisphaerae bacterium]